MPPQVAIVDTPGILSGAKQRFERNYNYVEVTEWFANRADLILLLFDPYKLDISDEFKAIIQLLKGHDDKVPASAILGNCLKVDTTFMVLFLYIVDFAGSATSPYCMEEVHFT